MRKYEDMEEIQREIYLERTSYLLSADDMIEEMLNKGEISRTMKPVNKTGWVCCGVRVRIDNAPAPRKYTDEQFPACDEKCRTFFGNATL